MPYIGNVLTSFAVETGNINDQAVTTPKLSATGGTEGQVLGLDAGGNLVWTSDPAGQWVTSGSDIYYNTGNVGIGTDTPANALDVSATNCTISSTSTGNSTGKVSLNADRAASTINGQILGQWNGNTVSRIDFVNGADDVNKDDGSISFLTSNNSSNPLPRMTIAQSGEVAIDTDTLYVDAVNDRVGVNTASPAHALDVQGVSDPSIRLLSTGTAGTDDTILRLSIGGTTASNFIFFGDSGDSDIGQIRYNHNADSLTFVVNTSTAATIDSSGRLLIGVTEDPNANAANRFVVSANEDSRFLSTGGYGIEFVRTGIPIENQDLGRVQFVGYDDASDTERTGVRIRGEADANWAAGDAPGRLIFSTSEVGGVTPIDRMTIDSDGNVGIGATNPANKLHIQDDTDATIRIDNTGGTSRQGRITVTNQGELQFRARQNTVDGEFVFIGYGAVTDEEYVRIDSVGRLLVGTNASITTNGQQVIQAVTGAGAQLVLARNDTSTVTNDNLGLIRFYGNDDDATFEECAAIACVADANHGTGNKPASLRFSTTQGSSSSPTERMRITSNAYVRLTADTNGLQFNGDTAAANALDDYEEGTWTPTFSPGTGSFTSVTYQVQSGTYVKIGNTVFLRANFYTNGITVGTASGNLNVTGLPFTGANLSGMALHDVRLWANNPSSVGVSGSTVFLYRQTSYNSNEGRMQVTDMETSGVGNLCQFSGVYDIA